MNYNLAQPFYESARKHPHKLALAGDGVELSYGELLQRVSALADWLRSTGTTPKRVGILASRSVEACVGILAAAWIGAAYVPISLAFPPLGIIEILKRSGLDALVADKVGSRLLSAELLAACPTLVVGSRAEAPTDSAKSVVDYAEISALPGATEPEETPSTTPGYILYTSGSTGIPKGVIVPVGGVDHLLRSLDHKYALTADDRVAETTATTFDLSVYNMFVTWRAGASLHIVPQAKVMAPAKFIQDQKITVWLSVPSIAAFMTRMKLLGPNVFPSLRQTFFAGEPLIGSVAAEWQKAAPSSTISNMYGPTEATVVCIGEDYGPTCAMTRDAVAIGRPLPGMKAAIATPDLTWAKDNENGELLLSGPQLAHGYLDDPEKTASRFVLIDDVRWYRTGDLAFRDSGGVFHYLGRIDNQVKISGYRVELEEIEFHLREVSGCESVAAVAWPLHLGNAGGIIAFLSKFDGSVTEIKDALSKRLPAYMVPSHIHVRSELPLNSNGKVDRNALSKLLPIGASVPASGL